MQAQLPYPMSKEVKEKFLKDCPDPEIFKSLVPFNADRMIKAFEMGAPRVEVKPLAPGDVITLDQKHYVVKRINSETGEPVLAQAGEVGRD